MTRRLAAVAFADVAGWTHLVEIDEVAALNAWSRLRNEQIEPAIRAHHGRLIDTAGDAVFVEFGSAVDAVTWALQLQSARKPVAGLELRLRIGLNVGDLLVDGEKLVGDEVNIASRLQQLAAPGETVATEAVRLHVHQRVAVKFHDLGERELKHVHRSIRVWRVEAAAVGGDKLATPVAAPAPELLPLRALLALDLPPRLTPGTEPGLPDRIAQAAVQAGGRVLRHDAQGLLIAFDGVRPAVKAAFALRQACGSASLPGMGVQIADALLHSGDLHGGAADLALQLGRFAGPGGIVASSAVRSYLTPSLDADVEDLGERYLEGMNQPVRAYRLEPPEQRQDLDPGGADELRPTIAVIPFSERGDGFAPIGEILAEEVIAGLSQCADLNVVSRLSTTEFRGRDTTLADVGAHLKANYVLSGAYRVAQGAVILAAELADARGGRVIWARELRGRVPAIVEGRDEIIDRLVAEASSAVIAREMERTRTLSLQSLQSLETCTLLIGAITLLHRLSPAEFNHAREMLQTVTQRAPRHAVPLAWLAKWHVLRVWQGWSDDIPADTRAAQDFGQRALDNDSHCSLALTIDGFVHTNLLKALDVGESRYDQALQVNPNDALAWLLHGVLHAFKGEGKLAVRGTRRALRLSPMDPHRYFFDVCAASAEIAAGHPERAVSLAQRSLRANRLHASTFRVLAIAQWLAGQHLDARRTVSELMRIQPALTVSLWQRSAPSMNYPIGRVCAEALRGAGVPA